VLTATIKKKQRPCPRGDVKGVYKRRITLQSPTFSKAKVLDLQLSVYRFIRVKSADYFSFRMNAVSVDCNLYSCKRVIEKHRR